MPFSEVIKKCKSCCSFAMWGFLPTRWWKKNAFEREHKSKRKSITIHYSKWRFPAVSWYKVARKLIFHNKTTIMEWIKMVCSLVWEFDGILFIVCYDPTWKSNLLILMKKKKRILSWMSVKRKSSLLLSTEIIRTGLCGVVGTN